MAEGRAGPSDRFGRLLALLVAMLLVSGTGAGATARVIGSLTVLATLSVGISVAGLRHELPAWQWGLVVVGGFVGLTMSPSHVSSLQAVAELLGAASLTFLLVAVFRRLLEFDTITAPVLAGALCVYLLIGSIFASVYEFTDIVTAGPLLSGTGRPDYTYYSFVTLTTVGFGDVAALSSIGRRITLLEAIGGQLFLATVVARVVSAYRGRTGIRSGEAAGRSAPRPAGSEPPG